jgi:hypothetical protein
MIILVISILVLYVAMNVIQAFQMYATHQEGRTGDLRGQQRKQIKLAQQVTGIMTSQEHWRMGSSLADLRKLTLIFWTYTRADRNETQLTVKPKSILIKTRYYRDLWHPGSS